MAYLYQDPNDPNNPLNAQPSGAAPAPAGAATTPAPTGAGGALLGGGAPAAAAPAGGQASSTPPPSSSGWTNLRAYLDANQDQAPGLATQVSGQITSQGQAAQNAIQGGVQTYTDTLSKSAPGDISGIIGSANSDPVAFASDPNNVSKFNALQSGLFNGPDTFENQSNYGNLASKADAASALPTMASSEGGQRQLLKTFNPQETEGQASLDQLLLSGVPDASKTLSDAAAPYGVLRSQLDTAAQSADAARTKAIGDTATAKDAIQTQFIQPQTQAVGNLESNINSRITSASADQAQKDQAIKDLESYMSGQSNQMPVNEENLFLPANAKAGGGYDTSVGGGLYNSVKNAIQTNINPVGGVDDSQVQNGINYLINNGSADSRVKSALDPLKGNLWQYLNDPIAKLKGSGVLPSNPQDTNWLLKYFPGTTPSSGTPSTATLATPQEASKILALQKLIAGLNPFLTEDQLSQAGTYQAPQIGTYQPTIGNISPLRFQPNPLQLGLV